MKIKIAIGIPTFGVVKTLTFLSVLETVNANKDINFFPITRTGSYINDNKEEIVSIAQKQLCSHVWFVDYDLEFDKLALPFLLAADKDIIGASYNFREYPIHSMVKLFISDGKTMNDKTIVRVEENMPITDNEVEKLPEKTFEAFGIPGGFMLVKMSVFGKMKPPYFPMGYDKDTGRVQISEDFGFCMKAREYGFKIWCDPTIKLYHWGEHRF